MIRDLKALGLALVAVFALGASVASAQQGTGTSDGPVTLTGTETGAAGSNGLTLLGVRLECPGSTYTGHKYNVTPHTFIPNANTITTFTPHYKQANHNCKATTGWVSTIHMNGCDYVGHIGVTTGGVAGTYGITFDVICPAGKEITITIFKNSTDETSGTVGCVLHIKEQLGLAGAHIVNTAGGHVGITGTVNGIHISVVKPAGAHLALCATQTLTAASFDVDMTVAGHSELGVNTGVELTHP